jgi:hypothetical protein
MLGIPRLLFSYAISWTLRRLHQQQDQIHHRRLQPSGPLQLVGERQRLRSQVQSRYSTRVDQTYGHGARWIDAHRSPTMAGTGSHTVG